MHPLVLSWFLQRALLGRPIKPTWLGVWAIFVHQTPTREQWFTFLAFPAIPCYTPTCFGSRGSPAVHGFEQVS